MTQVDEPSMRSQPAAAPPKRGARIAMIAAPIVVIGAVAVGYLALRKPAEGFTEPPRDVPTFDGQWIRYSPAFAGRAGLEFAAAENGALAPVVNVTGTVDFDPQKVAVIGARITGRARSIAKFPGDPVKPGETLATLESAELGHAQTSLLAARAHSEAANANEAREKHLAEAKVSSARDAELARASAQASKAELTAAEQRVRALGGDGTSGELGVLAVTSPIAGKVVESKLSRGQSVEASAVLFKVADLSRVWIELAVFERDLTRIHAGDAVEISPQTNTAITLKGKVAHVGDVINLETRSGDVRVVVDNPEGSLRPGQSVLARIHTQQAKTSVVVLPREAVTSVDGKATVFVAKDATSVEPRAITIGSQDGTKVEISSGLAAGERVAVKGVFALKSEIFR